MTGIRPWVFFLSLGCLAAYLLDAEASVPFFLVWSVAGIVLAMEADKRLNRQGRDNRKAGRGELRPRGGRPMEFSRY